MLTRTERRVWRSFTQYDRDHPRGSGYCYEQWTEEHLIAEWHLFGRKVWTRTLAAVEVPPHAWISSATLGFSDWQSPLEPRE